MCFIAVCPSAGESFTRAICAPSAAQEPIKNAWAASAPAEKQVRRTLHFGQSLFFFFFFQKGATGVQNFPKASMCFYRSWPEKLPTPFILFEFFCNPPCVCVCVCHRGSPVQRDSTDSSETNGGGTKKKNNLRSELKAFAKKKKNPQLGCPRCPVCARARVHKTTGK